jgi:hypothetical protein
VTLRCAGDFRDALRDQRFRDDHFWATVFLVLRRLDGCGYRGDVLTIDRHRIPALRGEILLSIFALGDSGHGVERHVVGVVN